MVGHWDRGLAPSCTCNRFGVVQPPWKTICWFLKKLNTRSAVTQQVHTPGCVAKGSGSETHPSESGARQSVVSKSSGSF